MSKHSEVAVPKAGTSTDETEAEGALLFANFPKDSAEKLLDITGPFQHKACDLRSQPPMNLKPYLDADLISKNDYAFLSAFQETKTEEERSELLKAFQNEVFTVLVNVIQHVFVVEELQKFLVLIDDMLWEDNSRVSFFLLGDSEPWNSFFDLLSCADSFVSSISSRIISKLICYGSSRPSEQDLSYFLNYLKNQLSVDNIYLLSTCRCLQRILKIDKYRLAFYQINGIFRIIRMLSSVVKHQSQYQLAFCIWISSYNSEIAENLNRFGVLPVLVDLLDSCCPSEIKLPRVAMATIRNMLEKPRKEAKRKEIALFMIQCKLYKSLDVYKMKYKDTDDLEFWEDINAVQEILDKYAAEISTFDAYLMEVNSGKLEWSVVHTSKPFWKENANRFNRNNYEVLRILISLLETSEDATSLCVAAYDIGEYMRHYSRGKKVIEELNGKVALLKLLASMHPTVRYQALRSLQILMLNSCDLLMEHIQDSKSMDELMGWEEDKS